MWQRRWNVGVSARRLTLASDASFETPKREPSSFLSAPGTPLVPGKFAIAKSTEIANNAGNERPWERHERRGNGRENRGLPTLEACGDSTYGFQEDRVGGPRIITYTETTTSLREKLKVTGITPVAGKHLESEDWQDRNR